jgi:3-hydroxyanthranilate 3,4-dioxygenase
VLQLAQFSLQPIFQEVVMTFPPLFPFNLKQWIEENRENWGPRRSPWEHSDFITMVHKGPTAGKQFHLNQGEEIFFQLEGELNCHYVTEAGERKVITLGPGEMFLLPGNVPHSPRREQGSWTLVIERKRRPDEVDGWIWYCENCNHKLYEPEPRYGAGPGNTVNQIVLEANKLLRSDDKLRTCTRCGDVFPAPI